MRIIKGFIMFCLFLFVTAVGTSQVQADGVVGNGTPGSCTEAAFDAALSGGGMVTFNCGPAPHIIILASQKSINNDTTIEGGNLITLSGANSTRLFDVGAVLILRDIVLTNAYFNGDGGAIRNTADGTLALDHVTIQNSTAALSGGAIVSYGPLNILDSTLAGNTADNGGALYLRFSGSQTNIVNSTLDDNQGFSDGGAILIWDGAAATIQNSQITNNRSYEGGGIYVTENASLTMEDSLLAANSTSLESGGGISNYGIVTLSRVTLNENASGHRGGGIYTDYGTLLLTDVTFSHNTSWGGGGLSNKFSTIFLTNVTFSSNVVKYQESYSEGGGGMSDFGGLMTLTNVTFSGNSADNSFGGGLKSLSSITTLTNVTFNNNTAELGGGIWFYTNDPSSPRMTVKNTIVANSINGKDCYILPGSESGMASAGNNLSSDTSCPFIQSTDQRGEDPLLGPLTANGGFTMTHLPAPGSPVIDSGVCLAQIPTDQRGVARPQGAACDTGAVERKALENSVYLPIIVR